MSVDNKTLDEAIASGSATAVVRVYRWGNPAMSIGVNQVLDDDVLDRCTSAGVEVVRRITGGGAVLHVDDVTYSVVGPAVEGVLNTYAWVARCLMEGLASIGVLTEICSHERPARAVACFSQPTGADLEVGGRKICGSAQVRRGGFFLQHGSIPVSDVRARTAHLLGTTEADASTCLSEVAPDVTAERLAEALVGGFVTTWGRPESLELEPESLFSRL